MHRKAVKYRDTWLAPGSEALTLHQERRFKELDVLLKKCDADVAALLGRYKRTQ